MINPGDRFGRLTVVSQEMSNPDEVGRFQSYSMFKCICDCGVTHFVLGINLTRTRNPVKSCGCLRFIKPQKVFIPVGYQSGQLTVISRPPTTLVPDRHIRFECQCSCGKKIFVLGASLIRRPRNTESCGCLAAKKARENITHGKSRTREYRIWIAMRVRCYRATCTEYGAYGGRGIQVCDRWRNSFANFLADVGMCPSKSHSLDRYPNNDGNYEPGNVRWATPLQQNNNTRGNRMLVVDGKSVTMAECARIANVPPYVIYQRLKRGLTPDEAVSLAYSPKHRGVYTPRKRNRSKGAAA